MTSNAEMLNALSSEPRPRPSALERVGVITFGQDAWDGAVAPGQVDFPMALCMLGLVPYEVRGDNIRTRQVEVTYRWCGFPLNDVNALSLPHYGVHVGVTFMVVDGREVREVNRICFISQGNQSSIHTIRVGLIQGTWVVHPTDIEWNGLVGPSMNDDIGVVRAPRFTTPQRRIVIR